MTTSTRRLGNILFLLVAIIAVTTAPALAATTFVDEGVADGGKPETAPAPNSALAAGELSALRAASLSDAEMSATGTVTTAARELEATNLWIFIAVLAAIFIVVLFVATS